MSFAMLFSLPFLLVGLAFLAVGAGMLIFRRRRQNRCTAVTSGTVSDNVQRYPVGSDGHRSTTVAPEFTYYAGGQWQKRVSHFSSSRPEFRVGEQVTVHYDPDEPTRYYVEELRTGKLLIVVFLAVGAGCLLVPLVVLAVLALVTGM